MSVVDCVCVAAVFSRAVMSDMAHLVWPIGIRAPGIRHTTGQLHHGTACGYDALRIRAKGAACVRTHVPAHFPYSAAGINARPWDGTGIIAFAELVVLLLLPDKYVI